MKEIQQRKDDGLSSYMFGKIQPQAIDLEMAILGAILIDKDALGTVIDILTAESFYVDANKLIYKSMLRVFERNYPIDLLTITEDLKKSGDIEAAGGPIYLVELTNRIGSSANIEFHARIVKQKHTERDLIQVSGRIISDAYSQKMDTFELIEQAERGIFDITQSGYVRAEQDISGVMAKVMKQLDESSKSEGGITGVPSGLDSLDRVTCGWQKTDLVILAARPGMGKTAFALSVAKNAAVIGNGVAIFSLEMSSTQLVMRMVSAEAKVDSYKLKSGKMYEREWLEVHRAAEVISALPIFIDDTPGISINEIRAKCRRLKIRKNIGLVVVDYLQLITCNINGNRDQMIGEISRGLKNLAKEVDVPVIALSQLSRAVETRGGSKRPMLSDLRESGSIEQDADMVGFIYRPEYYGIMDSETGKSLAGLAELIIAKHRNGALDTVPLKFDANYTLFSDIQDDAGVFDSVDDPIQPGTRKPIAKTSQNWQITAPQSSEDDVPF